MSKSKNQLLDISKKVRSNQPINPDELNLLLKFENNSEDSFIVKFLKHVALPASLVIGFFFAAFPDTFISISQDLPKWTNLSNEMLRGVDYFWDILGEPVGKANIVFHLPNIIFYSFGVLGMKSIIDSINRRAWIDKILNAQIKLKENLEKGTISYSLSKKHSILFVGNGDFIGMQYVLNHTSSAIIVSSHLPSYTNVWNYYDSNTLYDDLKEVIKRCTGKDAGEYIFFPVKDDQIFLPNEKAYDLSPHKLDILCKNIRTIEKEFGWKPKKIIIIGDKFHQSYVHSVDQRRIIPKSADTLSLQNLSNKYNNIMLLDPTDIVLKKILLIAKDRKIVFRATKEGINEYKERFYKRLRLLNYKERSGKKGILTIGYDIFEDQTEQQTLSRIIDDYLPVVLSKNVRDALIRNGYSQNEFVYVPELVLSHLTREAAKQ